MISHNHRVIFIHLPKCAGTSVECALDGRPWHGPELRDQQHLTAEETLAMYGRETFEAYFKLAVVRNPWDLLVAHYLWGSERSRGRFLAVRHWFVRWGHPFTDRRRKVKCPTFPQYLRNVAGYNRLLHFSSTGADLTQQRRSLSIDGELAVDCVVRFDELPGALHAVCRQAGIPQGDLPHMLGSGRGRHYSTFYNKQTRQLVADLYAEDIEFFGFRFEAP